MKEAIEFKSVLHWLVFCVQKIMRQTCFVAGCDYLSLAALEHCNLADEVSNRSPFNG
jgi:hypothetical protein